MTAQHPNLDLIQSLDPANLADAAEVMSPDVVWHYYNPTLPDLEGDYVGFDGLQRFFGTLAALSSGTFKVEPISATAVGDELVVVQTRNSLTIKDQPVTIDVVTVWRIVDGRVTEVWDIPSAFTQSVTRS